MSKIKYSALVSDVRNKLNGSVLSKNRYGNYIRNKTTPVNPQTTFQQNARSALAANSQAWGGLTEAQRLGWKALAQELPFTDIFGDSKILAANSLYCKLNGNLVKATYAPISEAPLKVSVPGFSNLELTATMTAGVLSGLDVTFDNSAAGADFAVIAYATPAISPGRSFVKNQFRFIGTYSGSSSITIDLFDEYVARFGTPASGQKIFVNIAYMSGLTGQQGIASSVMALLP